MRKKLATYGQFKFIDSILNDEFYFGHRKRIAVNARESFDEIDINVITFTDAHYLIRKLLSCLEVEVTFPCGKTEFLPADACGRQYVMGDLCLCLRYCETDVYSCDYWKDYYEPKY